LLLSSANAASDIFSYDVWQFHPSPSTPPPFNRAQSATYTAATSPSTFQSHTTADDRRSAGHVSRQQQMGITKPSLFASFQLPSWLQNVLQKNQAKIKPKSSPQLTYGKQLLAVLSEHSRCMLELMLVLNTGMLPISDD